MTIAHDFAASASALSPITAFSLSRLVAVDALHPTSAVGDQPISDPPCRSSGLVPGLWRRQRRWRGGETVTVATVSSGFERISLARFSGLYRNGSMLSPSAHDLYSHLVVIIDKAAADKNIYAVPEAAAAAGMEGSEEPRGLGQRWDFTYRDSTGFTVLVHARWWDQSKPFSIQPDMHVMSVELRNDITLMRHERRYEE